MAHTRGLVIKINAEGTAQVVTDRKNACDGCRSTHGCHSCLLNSKMMTEALNSAGAKEGDLVDVSLNSGTVLKGAAVMYLIPITGLIIGGFTGSWISHISGIKEEISSIIFGIVGLFLGFVLVDFIAKWMSAKNQFIPAITKIITSGVKNSPPSLSVQKFSGAKVRSGCH